VLLPPSSGMQHPVDTLQVPSPHRRFHSAWLTELEMQPDE
jgi:hypothetical protein